MLALMMAGTPSPTASAAPSSVAGSTVTSGATATSNAATATPSGGTAPYDYAWEFVSGDATIVANTPLVASTTFRATVGSANPDRVAAWRCKVTDALGRIAYTNTVAIDLSYIGP